MPSNILQADVGFPELTEEQTTDEKFQLVTNYLFMLREQLRYSLSNLDTNNFSAGGIDGLTKLITEPIYAQLEDEDGNFAAITAMADGLGVRIGNAEGQLTTLTATVNGLNSTVNDPNTGLVSQVTQNAARIGWVLKDESTQSSVSLTSAMFSAIANGISFTATNGSTSSTLKLSVNGVQVASRSISMSGLVSFTDLSTSGSTTINGSNITTGTIDADLIDTTGLYCRYLAANGTSSSNYAYVDSTSFRLYTSGAVKAILAYDSSDGNCVYLRLGQSSPYGFFEKYYESSAHSIWVGSETRSTSGCGMKLNMTSKAIWFTQEPTSGSDRRLKREIREDLDRYEGFFNALRPSTFLMDGDAVEKRHCGFVAQDLQEALHESGLEDTDFAALHVPGMGDEYYGLSYGEFIGLLTHMIQKQAGEIEALEARIAALEAN